LKKEAARNYFALPLSKALDTSAKSRLGIGSLGSSFGTRPRVALLGKQRNDLAIAASAAANEV
jgi:hypothetical protein